MYIETPWIHEVTGLVTAITLLIYALGGRRPRK